MKITQQTNEIRRMLVECRSEHGITLQQVAKATGFSAQAISNIEKGGANPRRTTVLRLESFLRKHGYFLKQVAA